MGYVIIEPVTVKSRRKDDYPWWVSSNVNNTWAKERRLLTQSIRRAEKKIRQYEKRGQ